MKTIWLCGAGLLGSWWLRFHAQRAWSLQLTQPILVIDNDRVEGRNLPTQNYSIHQVGSSKAQTSVAQLDSFGLPSLAVNIRLNLLNGRDLLKSDPPDLIVDAFDNHPSRVTAMILAKQAECPCLHLSISPQRFGRIEWSEKWHLDPTRLLEPLVQEEVEIPPCELIAYQNLGVQIGIKAALESTQLLVGSQTKSWMVTDHQTVEL